MRAPTKLLRFILAAALLLAGGCLAARDTAAAVDTSQTDGNGGFIRDFIRQALAAGLL